MSNKHELFSKQANLYAQFRPNYPTEMLDWIVNLCPERKYLWDCATGTGQVATALADKFDHVIATDINPSQLAHASQNSKVSYQQSPAEQTNITSNSINLITVAQALHWFNHQRFNLEVKRVLKPDGILAVWCYGLIQTNNAKLNCIIKTFYNEITGPYWEPERKHIDEAYQNIPIPFSKLHTPKFNIIKKLSREALIAYFATWSSVNTQITKTGESLVETWLKPQIDSLRLSNNLIECQWPITLIITKA